MVHITDILPNFSTLKEYRDFLGQLVEKSASGQEIARGMDKHDQSKQQKKQQVVSKEVEKRANGVSTETHYDHIDPNVEKPPEQPPVPLQPGQQVNIGNKQPADVQIGPKTTEIKVGSEKNKIELKPRLDINKQLR
jgi:hypothetical protein